VLYDMCGATETTIHIFRESWWARDVQELLGRLRNRLQSLLERGDQKKLKIYANIGPTAALVAYYRAYSDIPFARELALEIGAEAASRRMTVDDPLLLSRACIAFEARFKSIDAVLGRYSHVTRFVEIPAGFSTRGLTMTRNNPGIEYVECDLAVMLGVKQEALAHLLSNQSGSLQFQAASILDGDELDRAVSRLTFGPVAITTEGLLSYLTHEEKVVAARNVRGVLSTRGGVWVVTDLTRVFGPTDTKAAELRRNISTLTGFSPVAGCFDSIGQAKRFFEDLGFRVHDYRRSEVIDSLSTSSSSELSPAEIRSMLEPQATFALEV
jgi:O-methyltransferase involved in polyketide biosynthesis